MEFMEGKGAAQIVNEYMERELTEYKKVTEQDLRNGIAPEAKAAFNRKPYYNSSMFHLKSRPVLR